MRDYGFRVRIILARDSIISSRAKSLRLSLEDGRRTYSVKSTDKGQPIKESSELVVRGKGFTSEEEAQAVAQQIRRSLLLCGVTLRIGIGVRIEKLPATSVHFKMPYDPEVSQPDFGGTFSRLSHVALKLSDKQTLALELYNAYHFESSKRTRFITLVVAVESLTEAKKRSKKAQEYLESFRKAIADSELDADEKTGLTENLPNCCQESIGKTCRDLIEKRLGNRTYGVFSAVELFRECYKMRSQLVHVGRLKDKGRFLEPWIDELDRLVSDLLLADLETV